MKITVYGKVIRSKKGEYHLTMTNRKEVLEDNKANEVEIFRMEQTGRKEVVVRLAKKVREEAKRRGIHIVTFDDLDEKLMSIRK